MIHTGSRTDRDESGRPDEYKKDGSDRGDPHRPWTGDTLRTHSTTLATQPHGKREWDWGLKGVAR